MPRKITLRERKHGMKYCTFCKPLKTNAVWRNRYRGVDDPLQFACEKHKCLLKDGSHTSEKMRDLRADTNSEEHYTEADYQTWMRL